MRCPNCSPHLVNMIPGHFLCERPKCPQHRKKEPRIGQGPTAVALGLKIAAVHRIAQASYGCSLGDLHGSAAPPWASRPQKGRRCPLERGRLNGLPTRKPRQHQNQTEMRSTQLQWEGGEQYHGVHKSRCATLATFSRFHQRLCPAPLRLQLLLQDSHLVLEWMALADSQVEGAKQYVH